MEQDKDISGQAENRGGEEELTHKELDKVSGGLETPPAVLDPGLFQTDPLTGLLGGKGGITGDFGGKGGMSGEFGGRGGMGGDIPR